MGPVAEAVERAEARIEMKRPEEALEIIGKALAGDPESAELWLVKGKAHLSAGDSGGAVEAVHRALAAGADGAAPHYLLALALSQGGRSYEALEPALAAVRLAPEYARGHALVALALADRSRRRLPEADRAAAEARAAAAQAVALAPEEAWVQGQVGLVHRWLNDRAAARRHLHEAVRLSPDYSWALTQLAVVESQRHRPVKALRLARSALAADPGNFTVLRAAYGECRLFTARMVWGSVVLGLISLLALAPAGAEPEAGGVLRMVFAGVATAGLGFALVTAWRVPAQVRGFLLNRRCGRAWAVSLLATALSVAAIGWTPLSHAWIPGLLFPVALIAHAVLVRIVDQDALARFEAGENPEGRPPRAGPAPIPPHARAGVRPGLRLAALLLDSVVCGMLAFAVYFVGMLVNTVITLGALGDDMDAFMIGTFTVLGLVAAVLFCYHWLPVTRLGGTPGKLVSGLRIIDPATGLPPTPGRAAARSALHFLLGLIPVLGYAAEALIMQRDRPHYRGLKDDLAKTWVVRAHPTSPPAPVQGHRPPGHP
ncbi:RDD family protein [Nocardiopsis potens]|uniref:RDD family protein n=1 Tax=Nocardiopsis potens TaxID=1246458 RepID=UPI000349028E|nr:RDD family protein [Nocardiopsis potens]